MLDRIRSICKQKNMTIAQLERALGYGNGSIGKWANGSKMPPYDRVVAVAKYLGVDPEWMVYGTEPAEKTPRRNLLEDLDGPVDEQTLLQLIAKATQKLQDK